jgi:hypothetical protein
VTLSSPTVTIRWYHKLILIVCGLLVSVILVEIAARAFRLIPAQSDAEYRAVSRRVGQLGNPYDEFTTSGFVVGNTEFKVKIRQNKLGFRGDDISKTPPAGAQRILLLGDSYTASWEVSEGQRWSDWLDRWLNAGQGRYDVVNLGYPGYGTDREYLLYESYGNQLHADTVLLVMYVENDVHDSGEVIWKPPSKLRQTRSFFTLDDNGALVEHDWNYFDPTRPWDHESFPSSVIGWLNGNSLTYRLVRDSVRAVWDRLTGTDSSHSSSSAPLEEPDPLHPTSIPRILDIFFTTPDAKWDQAWQITGDLLAALRDAVASDGAQLVVAIVPPHMIVQNDYWAYNELFEQSGKPWDLWYPQNRMLALLDDLRIPVINPTQTLIDFRAATGQDVFYKLDRHFNRTGACVFGTALANALMADGYAAPDAAYPRNPLTSCETLP